MSEPPAYIHGIWGDRERDIEIDKDGVRWIGSIHFDVETLEVVNMVATDEILEFTLLFPLSFDKPGERTGKATWKMEVQETSDGTNFFANALVGTAENFIGLVQDKKLDRRAPGYVSTLTKSEESKEVMLERVSSTEKTPEELLRVSSEILEDKPNWEDFDIYECCADMMYPWSGRAGFVPLQLLPGDQPVERVIVSSMLQRENDLRLSKAVQQELSECYGKDDRPGMLRQQVYRKVQEQVVSEFGFEDLSYGLRVLRSVETSFPGDTELSNLSYYRRFNRSRPGRLCAGSVAPDLPLIALHSKQCAPISTFFSGMTTTRPTVILAGSAS
jgi:hypothetical protein